MPWPLRSPPPMMPTLQGCYKGSLRQYMRLVWAQSGYLYKSFKNWNYYMDVLLFCSYFILFYFLASTETHKSMTICEHWPQENKSGHRQWIAGPEFIPSLPVSKTKTLNMLQQSLSAFYQWKTRDSEVSNEPECSEMIESWALRDLDLAGETGHAHLQD